MIYIYINIYIVIFNSYIYSILIYIIYFFLSHIRHTEYLYIHTYKYLLPLGVSLVPVKPVATCPIHTLGNLPGACCRHRPRRAAGGSGIWAGVWQRQAVSCQGTQLAGFKGKLIGSYRIPSADTRLRVKIGMYITCMYTVYIFVF